MSHNQPIASPRPLLLLVLAITLGATLAAAGLFGGSGATATLPPGAVARVNGTVIRMEEYQRAVNGVGSDRRSPVTPEMQRQVLDRIIEEELLLQKAVSLGLVRDDMRVRRALTSAMIETAAAGGGSVEPSDAELEKFYAGESDFFASPGQLQVQQVWFRANSPAEAPAAQQRAAGAVRRLRGGESVETVQRSGDAEFAPLPNGLLPAAKLGDYLGPTALRTVFAMQPGEVSEPVRSNTGYHVLVLLARTPGDAPAFEDIKPQILAEFRRRGTDRALRQYLDELRSAAEVELAPDLP